MGTTFPPNVAAQISWSIESYEDYASIERASATTAATARKEMERLARSIMTPEQLSAWMAATSLSTPKTCRSCEWYLTASKGTYVIVTLHDSTRDQSEG